MAKNTKHAVVNKHLHYTLLNIHQDEPYVCRTGTNFNDLYGHQPFKVRLKISLTKRTVSRCLDTTQAIPLSPKSFSHISFNPTTGREFETLCQDTFGTGVLLHEQRALWATKVFHAHPSPPHPHTPKENGNLSLRNLSKPLPLFERNDRKTLWALQ